MKSRDPGSSVACKFFAGQDVLLMIRQGVAKQDRTAVKNALQLAYQLQTPIEACQETAESQGVGAAEGSFTSIACLTFWDCGSFTLLRRLPQRLEVFHDL